MCRECIKLRQQNVELMDILLKVEDKARGFLGIIYDYKKEIEQLNKVIEGKNCLKKLLIN